MHPRLTDFQWMTLVALAGGWREVTAIRYSTTVNACAVGVLERAGLALTWDSAIGCRRAAITIAGRELVTEWLSDAGQSKMANELHRRGGARPASPQPWA